jgi:serine/threonine protein kinase
MQSIARDEHLSRPTVALQVCERMQENLFQGWKVWIMIYRVQLFHALVVFRIFSNISGLLRSLITRHATNRPTPATLPSHPFFSSLPISTLNFLDRSNFTSKTREEKISFMKGLINVLDRFSESLRTRKILPTLLEEVAFPLPL